jgi:hypothetical protein
MGCLATKPWLSGRLIRFADYRLHSVKPGGRISAPPVVIDCPSDQEAAAEAVSLMDGMTVEIWEGSRLVERIEPIAP